MPKKPKPFGGSGAVQAQQIQHTLTWTRPLKFLRDLRYKGFLTDGNKEKYVEKPPEHAPLHEKMRHHFNKMQLKTGEKSLHKTAQRSLVGKIKSKDAPPEDAPFHEKAKHHLDKIHLQRGERSLKHVIKGLLESTD
ncbi:hypothetical protein ACFLQ2_00955 [archaeon]